MTASEPTTDPEKSDTTTGDDIEHRLGGTTAPFGGAEIFVRPDNDARLVVDQLEGERVRLRLVSTGVNTQHILNADEARAAAARLDAAADRVADDE